MSNGDHDLVTAALEKLGGGSARHLYVAVKPGKHLAVASLGRRHVPAFALPGNPVAALVAYELLVRPALRSMAGCAVPGRPRIAAIAETDLPGHPGPKLHVMRVIARAGPDGAVRVRPSGGQDSHMLRAMALANALALLPGGNGVRAGGRVEVLLLDADRLLHCFAGRDRDDVGSAFAEGLPAGAPDGLIGPGPDAQQQARLTRRPQPPP